PVYRETGVTVRLLTIAIPGGMCGDRSALRLREAFDDVQTEPDSAEAPAVSGLPLDEPLEDPLVVAVLDADPLVHDRHHDVGPVADRPDADGPAVRRVLERDLQQLPEDDVGRHRVPPAGRQ